LDSARVQPLLAETEELIRIFAASLRTAQSRNSLKVER
jgi:hypothetical protein